MFNWDISTYLIDFEKQSIASVFIDCFFSSFRVSNKKMMTEGYGVCFATPKRMNW